jgi:pimeloyl-ACP methyl ester carboxylesterase
MPIVEANGLRIDCELHGEPGAPVVLLIMGLGMPAALWPDPLIATLTGAGFRVVTFDNRDAGGSTRFEGVRVPNVLRALWRALRKRPVSAPYTLYDMAADTVGVLDALGIERVHVVGASMGGMIGQVVGARYPDRVLSLTSIMSNSGNPERRLAFGRWKALRALLHRPPPPDDHAAVVRHLTRVFGVIGSPGYRHELEAMRPLFERVARRGLYRAGTSRQMLAILSTGDRRPLLGQIAVPTLVLHGADDPLVPEAAGRDTAANVPGAAFESVPGMGHDFPPSLMAMLAERIVLHCRAAQASLAPAAAVAAEPATAQAVATQPAAHAADAPPADTPTAPLPPAEPA